MARTAQDPKVVEVTGLSVRLGGSWVFRGVDLEVRRGEILALVGESGGGKTTLMRSILGLIAPAAGTVKVLDQDVHGEDRGAAHALRMHWGVMFQQGALFSALPVFDNVAFPLRELRVLGRVIDEDTVRDLVMLKLTMVGLKTEDAWKIPAELSGGMIKRAALARALALEPDILFLDEPTSGLDPSSARDLNRLLTTLHQELKLSALMITHNLETISSVPDRIAFLSGGQVLATGTLDEVASGGNGFVQRFFQDPRRGASAEPAQAKGVRTSREPQS
jgi:phospholipid/cholesterol/gamma-HCH transport system ATP-binding protein